MSHYILVNSPTHLSNGTGIYLWMTYIIALYTINNIHTILVQNSSKTTKKFFTFDVSTSIRGLHQKKLVLGLLLPVLGAIS